MKTALIWDFDGTLFDTYPGMVEAARRALNNHGHAVDPAEILGLMKISMNFALNTLRARYALDEGFLAEYKAIVSDLQIERARPYPGIPQLLRTCAAEGRMHFIYTHRGTSTGDILSKHGLNELFTEIIHNKSEAFVKKPGPESIQHLLTKYRVPAAAAMMIGDRGIDIASAHNAGVDGCLFDPDGLAQVEDANYRASAAEALREIIASI